MKRCASPGQVAGAQRAGRWRKSCRIDSRLRALPSSAAVCRCSISATMLSSTAALQRPGGSLPSRARSVRRPVRCFQDGPVEGGTPAKATVRFSIPQQVRKRGGLPAALVPSSARASNKGARLSAWKAGGARPPCFRHRSPARPLPRQLPPHAPAIPAPSLPLALPLTRFGEHVAVVGSFSGWDTQVPVQLEWSEGSVWSGEAELPAG